MRKLPKLYDYQDEPKKPEGNVSMKRAIISILSGFAIMFLFGLVAGEVGNTGQVYKIMPFFLIPMLFLLVYGFTVFLINIFKLVWDALTS